MKLRFEETTRGSGKIFIHLVGEDMPSSATVEAVARRKGKRGSPLPARVLSLPGVEGWVLVLGVFAVAQHVTATVRSREGYELGRFEKKVMPSSAKLQSRVNTATHNPITNLIRNCDRSYVPQAVRTHMSELIWNATGSCDVIHGVVEVRSLNRDEAEAPFDLSFLGPKGKEVSLGPWKDMGSTLSEQDGVFLRSVNFSVRVPIGLKSLAIWAKSPQTSLDDGFMCYESFVIADAEQRWRNRTIAPEAVNHDQMDLQYEPWFVRCEKISNRDAAIQRAREFSQDVLFSIVVPLYRTPLEYFHEMVLSVLNQTYANFELILVNASPEDVALNIEIEKYAHSDKRIHVVRLANNLGITKNTLEGIRSAKGDFVSFLDHDDVIEPDLLYSYMEGLEKYPTTDLLYCDEDKLRDGRLGSPAFKSDWNLDLERSQNYVCHMLTVRKGIVDELPSECERCEGTFDHYLTLFASERARNIYHARKVLYHWRIHAQSTAGGGEAKSYTTSSGVRSVQAHLDRCGINAKVSARSDVPNTYRVDYGVDGTPLVSIVIPNKDMVPILRRCIDSIAEKTTYGNYEVIVVENNSTDEATFAYYEEAQKNGRVRVVRQPSDGTFNFAKSSNYGASCAKGDYLLFLNNDTSVITPSWIERMLGQCQREDVGCVGVKLLYPDDLIQHAGVIVHRGVLDHIGKKLDARSCEYFNTM